jgi:hypothetical protein
MSKLYKERFRLCPPHGMGPTCFIFWLRTSALPFLPDGVVIIYRP